MERRTLGDYNIIKSIGQGTLGAVFLAEHRFMKRQYVLKVLPEELASDRGFIQRFEEEVSLLASIDHPNIVKIYNVSFSQGQYFLVTDCIVDELGETTNLAQYVMGLGRPLEEEELFHILKQIAEALDYAHSKNIGSRSMVHRCLKLNNILIGKGRQGLDIHLSDFGLSRIVGAGAVLSRTYKNVAEALSIGLHLICQKNGQDYYPNPPIDQPKLTSLHTSFLQNYAFLAPEQKRLDSSYIIDKKADVYAFGVLVYYLLMSELPEGLFEMPSSRSQYRYQWDLLLQKCLQNNPHNRPEKILPQLEAVFSNSLVVKPKQQLQLPEDLNLDEIISREELKVTIPSMSSQLTFNNAALVQENLNANEEAAHLLNSVCLADDSMCLSSAVETINTGPSTLPSFATLKPVLLAPQLEKPRADMDPSAIFHINSSVKAYSPEPQDVTNIKPLLTDMITIQGGTFYRGSQDGSRDEMPKHRVTLNSFAIDIHPVTNEQFVRFLEVMGGEKDNNHHDIIRLRDSRIKRSGGKLSIESGYSKHPVVGVTWYGAVGYAKWIGKRLPSEAEWEIAARGGSESYFYTTGSDIEKTQANFFSSDTTAVMSYVPNNFGLYDMAGNVYEWCHDWYGYNYYEISVQEPENPQGPLQGVYRVLRGGCWKSLKEDLRCSRRHRNNPGTVNGTYGFRCAADALIS